jgi:hypothetical protein
MAISVAILALERISKLLNLSASFLKLNKASIAFTEKGLDRRLSHTRWEYAAPTEAERNSFTAKAIAVPPRTTHLKRISVGERLVKSGEDLQLDSLLSFHVMMYSRNDEK